MSNRPPLPADDARQRDELDAFLNGLTSGNPNFASGLDPTLTATVRYVHRLANDAVAADIRRAGKAHRWKDLMRTNATRSTVTPFPTTATLPRSFAPPPIPLRPVMRQSRLRRLGGQSLGLVATLTLVLLVAASSLAVYLSAPQSADEPTMIAAAYGGSPEATPSSHQAMTPDASYLARYPDLTIPYLHTCDVQPRTLEDLSTVLSAPIQPNSLGTPRLDLDPAWTDPAIPASLLPATYTPDPLANPVEVILDAETRGAITATWARYRSCELSHDDRRTAVFKTDDALLREIYGNGRNCTAISLLSAEPRADNLLRILDQPDDMYLGSFRQIDSDHVMADILIPRSNQFGERFLELYALVVFVQQDGEWLIDELGSPSRG